MKISASEHLTRLYFRILNLMHRPFVRRSTNDPYHAVFAQFIALTKQAQGASLLEIGARNFSENTHRVMFQHCGEHVGLDVLPGKGVDVVADAHQLSKSLPTDHFDFVFSISVFEHLLFPWKVAMELNQVLKVGGHVFTATNPVWPEHEMPWDFWRFPHSGCHALFNAYTGFEIVAISEGLPCKMYSLVSDRPTRGHFRRTLNQGVSVIAKKIGNYRSDLLKYIGAADVLNTMYPSKAAA